MEANYFISKATKKYSQTEKRITISLILTNATNHKQHREILPTNDVLLL